MTSQLGGSSQTPNKQNFIKNLKKENTMNPLKNSNNRLELIKIRIIIIIVIIKKDNLG